MNKFIAIVIVVMLPFFTGEMCGDGKNQPSSSTSSLSTCKKLSTNDIVVSSIPGFTSRYKLDVINSYSEANTIISNKSGTKESDADWMDSNNNDSFSGLCPVTISFDTTTNYLVITLKTSQCANLAFTDTLPTKVYCASI